MSEDRENSLEAIDIFEILKLLPHRYPFLLVDRIIDIQGDDFGTGIKNVTFNEPHFMGHFPSQPVMPGVLLIEAMAQTAGALCIREAQKKGNNSPSLVYFMSIEKAKFRKPVVPGDQVRFKVVKQRHRGTIWKYESVAEVDGTVVAEAVISAMMMTQEAGDI